MELPVLATAASEHRRSRRPWRRACALTALTVVGGLLGFSAPLANATSGTRLPGIDVSHHNGTIDWDQVKDAGIKFAFAKATEGTTFVDDEFFANRAGATREHIAFG